jgi:peptidyl-prolyl cis-trans isomerase C
MPRAKDCVVIAGKSQLRLATLTALTTIAVSVLAAPPLSDAERRALPVASYEGGAVTVGELEDAIADSSPLIQATAMEPANLRELLDRHLRFELQLKEAERRGYRDAPDVRRTSRENAVKIMLSREVDAPLRSARVSPEVLREYFESHRDLFGVREKRRATAIFVASEADARALVPQVKAANEDALRQLVQTRGLDVPSKARGGALGSFDNKGAIDGGGTVDPKLVSAAFALAAVGAVSGPIKLDAGGFAVLKLTEVRPGSQSSFHEMQVRVRRRYDEERYQKEVDAIAAAQREILKPVVHYELIEQIEIK